jgi:antitoxin component of MazEF toxin-antitoxin module
LQELAPTTIPIVRVGNTLTVEIPEELATEAALPIGDPVEWVRNGSGGIALVKSSWQSPANQIANLTLDESLVCCLPNTST